MSQWFARHAADDFCYLTTIGRVSGQPRTIEIWFAVDGDSFYLLAQYGERAHWVRNLQANPAVTLRLGETTRAASARIVLPPQDQRARELIAAKYEEWCPGEKFDPWVVQALPVAIEVVPER